MMNDVERVELVVVLAVEPSAFEVEIFLTWPAGGGGGGVPVDCEIGGGGGIGTEGGTASRTSSIAGAGNIRVTRAGRVVSEATGLPASARSLPDTLILGSSTGAFEQPKMVHPPFS